MDLAQNPENLTAKEQARLNKIDTKHLVTAKAYQMKLLLQDTYRHPGAGAARHRFEVWCRWVKWAARHVQYNLLRPMAKLADTIQTHLKGILAHWKSGLTNAFMEGLNSVFQATKRKARGYRSPKYLITILYFIAAKLRLPHT